MSHRREKVVAALVGAAIPVALVLVLWARPQPLPVPRPQPTPGPDTGWHMAIDPYAATYRIDLRYDEMNDTQRDDANRFARLRPDGEP